MPDISCCKGAGCPLKKTCYRHTAKPSQWQTYFSQPPIENGKCEYYWQTEEVSKCPIVKQNSKKR